MHKIQKKSEFSKRTGAMSIVEARNYLGVSYPTMKKILNSGEVRYRKVGGRFLITEKALDDWLQFRAEGGRNDD